MCGLLSIICACVHIFFVKYVSVCGVVYVFVFVCMPFVLSLWSRCKVFPLAATFSTFFEKWIIFFCFFFHYFQAAHVLICFLLYSLVQYFFCFCMCVPFVICLLNFIQIFVFSRSMFFNLSMFSICNLYTPVCIVFFFKHVRMFFFFFQIYSCYLQLKLIFVFIIECSVTMRRPPNLLISLSSVVLDIRA